MAALKSEPLPPLPQTDTALTAPNAPPAQVAQAQPQAPPAPTHAQTVASLRHFYATIAELRTLMKNPDLGRADIRSAIIDGTTNLVSGRIVPPNEAVTMLATVPDRPFDQKTWVQTHLQQQMQARGMVLAQHAAAFAGQGPEPAPSADTHMQDMSGMMQAHYAGRQ